MDCLISCLRLDLVLQQILQLSVNLVILHLLALRFVSKKISYVTRTPYMTRACVHLGILKHPEKFGEYRNYIKQTWTLNSEHVEQMLSATRSSIMLETAEELVGPLLLAKEGEPQKILELEELEPIFDGCKHLTSPNIGNCAHTVKSI